MAGVDAASQRGDFCARDGYFSQAKRSRLYHPTPAEWASLVVEGVEQRAFRSENLTEGKISINEDRATPIFSPYSGRVTKLLVKPGDVVARGQPCSWSKPPTRCRGLNDFMSAPTCHQQGALDRSTWRRSSTSETTISTTARPSPLKDWQKAQAELITAQNDLRSAETALEAARNRLRILGRDRRGNRGVPGNRQNHPGDAGPSPIAGTIVQRKVGPRPVRQRERERSGVRRRRSVQVWLIAYVRETDAAKVGVGQDIDFTVLAFPDSLFGKIDYVAAALDPASRRLLVRATVENPDGCSSRKCSLTSPSSPTRKRSASRCRAKR